MEDIVQAKRIRRAELRRRIAAIGPVESRRKSGLIVSLIRERLERERPAVVGVFAGMAVEPDLLPLLEAPSKWVFPTIRGDHLTLWAVERIDQLSLQAHGIREPVESVCSPVDPGELTWILVPGLGFGRDGSRLGRGKGYYDRLLADATGLAIGVAFTEQVEDAMPMDEWDRPVAEIVTDQGWIRCAPPL